MALARSIVFVACLVQAAMTQFADHDNYFINPPPSTEDGDHSNNLVYHIGSTIHFQWVSNYDTRRLVPIPQGNPAGQVLADVSGLQSYDWKVPPDFFAHLWTPQVNLFFAKIYEDPDNYCDAHSFNITRDNPESTSIITTSEHTATNTSGSNSTADHGTLSKRAKIGTGVGVGIAACLFIGFVVGLVVYNRRSQPPTKGPGDAEGSSPIVHDQSHVSETPVKPNNVVARKKGDAAFKVDAGIIQISYEAPGDEGAKELDAGMQSHDRMPPISPMSPT